jgi:hypothetical protein
MVVNQVTNLYRLMSIFFNCAFYFIDIYEMKGRYSTLKSAFNPFEADTSNPSSKPQMRQIPAEFTSVAFSDNEQRDTQSPASIKRLQNSSKVLPSPNLEMKNNHPIHTPSSISKQNQTIRKIVSSVPITPIQSSPLLPIRGKGRLAIYFSLKRYIHIVICI